MSTEISHTDAAAHVSACHPAPTFLPAPTVDGGIVRVGVLGPCRNPALTDSSKVRIGGQAPVFLPAAIADAGLVRLGGQSPTF